MSDNKGTFIHKSGSLRTAEKIKNYLYECAILRLPLEKALNALSGENYIRSESNHLDISNLSDEEVRESIKDFYKLEIEDLYDKLLDISEKKAYNKMRDDFMLTPKAGANVWGRYLTADSMRKQQMGGGQIIGYIDPVAIRSSNNIVNDDLNKNKKREYECQ